MSEYQYYEFQAIDKPLSAADLDYIRSLSRRVQPTPTHAVFSYSYGDFPGNALQVLAKYYDAMLYLANWGSRQLAFRFPRAALDLEALKPHYFGAEAVELKTTKQHVILEIGVHPEGGGEWIEGEGRLSDLLPLRDDLLRGDYRVLYLTWLLSVQDEEDAADEDEEDDSYADDEDDEAFEEDDDSEEPQRGLREPPVPPGLGQLTPALRAFIELFDIDEDLVAAAAQASPPLKPVDEPIERWVGLLPPAERDAWLVRVARGEAGTSSALLHRLRELSGGRQSVPNTAPRRSIGEIWATAEQFKRQREEQQRREAAQAKQHKLDGLAKREGAAWKQVTALIEQKQAAAYDQAVALLVDLRDLAARQGQSEQFKQRIAAIATEYARRPALLERLRKQRLLS